jgi:hypothetical protein
MNKAEKSAYNRAYGLANKERIAAKRAARRAGIGENVRRCSIPGCDGIYDSHGMCGRHYAALIRNDDPLLVLQEQHHGKTAAERLELRTKRGPKCWEWTGAKNLQGYGVMRVGEGNMQAHRVAYVARHGDIPDGMNVLHRCDNPACVRVSHLFLGTLADNNADMRAKGRNSGPKSKLTERAVRLIKASSAKNVDLAHRFGVSETTIRAIRRYGQTWRPR